MSSELKTNKVSPATGTALQIGDSGDTITIPSGATLTNSGSATGFGKVLQTVSASYATTEITTSLTYVDTSLTAAITPASSSNKILIWVTSAWFTSHASNPAAYARIYNSTDTVELATTYTEAYDADSSGWMIYHGMPCSIIAEDTGRSIATTYKLQHRAAASGRNSKLQNENNKAFIILMEIAA